MENGAGTNGYPLLLVDWKDAHCISEWKNVSDINHALVFCRSVGYRIGETDESITLAATNSEEVWNDIQIIPKVLIVLQKVITP